MISADIGDLNRLNLRGLVSEARQMTSHLIFATDPNFQNQTTIFKPGQSIYVKVSTDLGNAQKKVLNLRDNNYGLISSYSFNSSGNAFISNFTAPSNSGIYSVEADISANGSVVNLVKTIQIEGEQTQSSSVSVSTNVQSKSDNGVDRSSLESIVASPLPEVKSVKTESVRSFWENLFTFFRKIFAGA